MIKVVKSAALFFEHYRTFGRDGISFLLKRRNKNNKRVQIKLHELAHPLEMRNNTTDIPMFYCIYANREMDVKLDFEPSVIVDCGAHIGLSAVLFANKYPKATIYAIEPEASNFEMLAKNTKPYPQITCLNKAIWNEPATLKIRDEGLGNWGYMTETAGANDIDNISSISITELLNNYKIQKIDLCKINIEGAEKELFEKNYDEWLSKTNTIIIELHDHMKPGCTNSFFNALKSYDFNLSPCGSYVVVKEIKKASNNIT